MNNPLLFLFFRRMRVPLIVLIAGYSIATLGFTLMPGVDDQGDPWRMSLFQAFYVVSYTGSTIGFGEIPYEFTQAQRMWTVVSIYLTVLAWLFAIGSIFALLQDPVYRQALQRVRLRRGVRAIAEPFYLVCGYGDTGRMLTRALTGDRHPVVVIDHQAEKMEALATEDLGVAVPAFTMNARLPENLVEAGLRSRWCVGVIAATGDDRANLKIAITAKLLNHRTTVYARSDSREVSGNMRSFETNHVISPVEEYVRRMRLAFEKPDTFRLYHWLASGPLARVPEARTPPRGRWILCGFGAPGRAIHAMLREIGMEVTVIEERSDLPDLPGGTIQGRGTQAETLREAGIESAVGILAVTSEDSDNLSILITARQLNKGLFLGTLENGLSSRELFRAAAPDFIGRPSSVVAGTILSRIHSALVEPFFERLLERDNAFGRELLDRLVKLQSDGPPEFSAGRISPNRSPAVAGVLERGTGVPLGALLRDPANRDRRLPLEVLMIRRDDEVLLCPADDLPLASGDRLLLAGRPGAARRVSTILQSENALTYVLTGEQLQHGWLWRWLRDRKQLRHGG